MLHRLTVIVDEAHHPVGACVVTDYEGERERVWPHDPGPFDTPAEVMARMLERLDVQLALF